MELKDVYIVKTNNLSKSYKKKEGYIVWLDKMVRERQHYLRYCWD